MMVTGNAKISVAYSIAVTPSAHPLGAAGRVGEGLPRARRTRDNELPDVFPQRVQEECSLSGDKDVDHHCHGAPQFQLGDPADAAVDTRCGGSEDRKSVV